MRNIKYLFVHCTGTQPEATVKGILDYWKYNKGWKAPGYHFLIDRFGKVHNLLSIDEISNGVQGFNRIGINFCYIGGIDRNGSAKDTRTPEQVDKLINLLVFHKLKFPVAKIRGHRDMPNVNKACPSFDVRTWLQTLAEPEKTILTSNN